jgi:O-antigen/teichoic acid export membrane protein
MTLKKQAISGFFWTGLQQFGRQGIAFITSIILARILSPYEFGLIAMIGIFIALGDSLIKGGLTNSLIRSENISEDDYSTVFIFNLIGSLLIYLLLYILAPSIATFYKQTELVEIIRWYGIVFIINALSAVQITRLTKKMDFKTQLIISLPSIFLSSSIGIYLAYNDYGVWSLVWSAIVQSLASTIQLWLHTRWIPNFVFSKEKFKLHFSYGVRIMLASILDIIFVNIYTLIIGRFFLPIQVGYYNRANTLQMFPVTNLSMIVNKVSFPLFASIQNDDIRLKQVFRKMMQLILYVIAPILVLMAVLAEPIFRFLFTEKWLPAVPYFQILCYNGILYPIHSYNLQILNVKGRSDLFLKLEVLKKTLAVIMILITFQFGIYGLLIGSTITSTIAFFINTYFSGKLINYNAFDQLKDLFPTFAIAALMGGITFFSDYFFIRNFLSDLLRILTLGIFGLLFFAIFSFILKLDAYTEIKHIIFKK